MNSGDARVRQIRDQFCYFLALRLHGSNSNFRPRTDRTNWWNCTVTFPPHLTTIETYMRSCIEGISVRCETKVIIGELLETSGAIGAAYLWHSGDQ